MAWADGIVQLAYEIPSTFRGEARLAFGLMVIQLSMGFIGLLPEGIMFAHHDFVLRNVIRVAGVLLRFGLTIALLSSAGVAPAARLRPDCRHRL